MLFILFIKHKKINVLYITVYPSTIYEGENKLERKVKKNLSLGIGKWAKLCCDENNIVLTISYVDVRHFRKEKRAITICELQVNFILKNIIAICKNKNSNN